MTDVPNVPKAGPMKAAPPRARALVQYQETRKDKASPDGSPSPTPYHFEGHNISIVDIDGEPWFVASDVARELGHRDAPNLIRSLDDDEKRTHSTSTRGGIQTLSIVSEPGLYRSIVQRRASRRNDPSLLAKIDRFQRWVFHDILPSIRRTGAYTVPALVTAPPALDLQAMLQDMSGLQTLVVGLLGRGAELERENAEKALVIAQKTALVVAQDQAIEDMRPRAAAGARFVELNGAVCLTDAAPHVGAVLSSRQGYSRHEYPLMPMLSGDILSRSTKNVEPRLAIPQGWAHRAHSIVRVQAPYRARDLAIPRIARSQGCPLCGHPVSLAMIYR